MWKRTHYRTFKWRQCHERNKQGNELAAGGTEDLLWEGGQRRPCCRGRLLGRLLTLWGAPGEDQCRQRDQQVLRSWGKIRKETSTVGGQKTEPGVWFWCSMIGKPFEPVSCQGHYKGEQHSFMEEECGPLKQEWQLGDQRGGNHSIQARDQDQCSSS